VNAIMSFQIMVLFWVVLTVGAAIAAIIARIFFPGDLGKESRTALGHRYTAPGRVTVRAAHRPACWRAPRSGQQPGTATAMRLDGSR
jgi:hypothetical protein